MMYVVVNIKSLCRTGVEARKSSSGRCSRMAGVMRDGLSLTADGDARTRLKD